MNVSAVIPTYNRATIVLEAIHSLLSQTDPPDEIIIVDDGSTDSTAEELASLTDRIRLISQPNRGVSAARNRGICEARYEWIAFLDSDDLWFPRKLQVQKEALQRHPDLKVCYTDEEWRKGGKWKNQGKKHKKYSGFIYKNCLPLCIISPSSVLVHVEVFRTVGLFDELLPACEDYDLWLRLAHRFPVLYIEEKLIVKRSGGWPQLSDRHSLDEFRIIALHKMLSSGELSGENKKETERTLKKKCEIYRAGCLKHGKTKQVEWIEEMEKIIDRRYTIVN
jgi:glycosyltransferase involved in cell wall biosynthesis